MAHTTSGTRAIALGSSPTRRNTRIDRPFSVAGNIEQLIKNELKTLSESPFEPDFPSVDTNREVPFLGDLESSIATLRGRETGTTPEELAGLKGLFASADPTLRLQKAQDFINKIVGPRNEAAAIAAGFGRGPAALEATTRAGAELALPIVTEAGRQQAIANQFKIALSQASLARGVNRDREVFEAVAAKVSAGQSTRSLNLQATGLKSEQEISRANIGLSTQDRTLALINQLRALRTSQAGINASASGGGGVIRRSSGAGGGGPGLEETSRAQSNFDANIRLERSRISAFERQGRFSRQAAEATARDARLSTNPLSSFGGLSSGFSSSPGQPGRPGSPGVLLSGGGSSPSSVIRRPLTGASSVFA